MMLGYVLKLPVSPLVDEISSRIASTYSQSATLQTVPAHHESLSMHTGALSQGAAGQVIRLIHIFVDMRSVAAV